MASRAALSLWVFGAGHGESVLLVYGPAGENAKALVVDAYATEPLDSPESNPVIGLQPGAFRWDQVAGLCLTHAHEDHYMGLASVARKTSSAMWMWPSGIPLESIVKHYKDLAKYRPRRRQSGYTRQRWIAESIEQLATWAAGAKPFQIISGLEMPISVDGVSIRCIAPSHSVSRDYAKQLSDSVDNWWGQGNPGRPQGDFHNVPSAGLVVDVGTEEKCRVVLLGDMVVESWPDILHDAGLVKFLSSKKADVLKLPHHCSKGAVSEDILHLLCDPDKTRGVLTPFRIMAPPPDDSAVELARRYMKELWCTVALPRGAPVWRYSKPPDTGDMALRSWLKAPTKISLSVGECMVRFDVDSAGSVLSRPGRYAHCLKAVGN